jgi:hypothetical protein
MKMLKLSTLIILLGSLGYAGGDISPVSDYEIEDAVVADEEAYIEPIVEEPADYIEPIVEEPVVVAPEPKPEPVIVAPKPVPVVVPAPVPIKNISANGFYAGLGITGARYRDSCHCKKGVKVTNRDTTYGGMAKVGYDFNQYVGVEARGLKTNWKSDGSRVEHAGIFVKPMLPVGNSSNIYGLIGAGKTKTKGSMPHADTESLALGAGIEVDLSKDTPKDGRYSRPFDGHGDQEKGVGLFVDYERMVAKKHAPILDAVSAGVTYDF